MTNSELLLQCLRRMGVERIYASPGSDWAPVWETLAADHPPDTIPAYVSVRHEETAMSMASGYARASGKLPAVMLHTTVGALHAAMCLRAALHERVPMVVFAGESIGFSEPPGPMLGRQWLRLLTDTGGPARLIEPCVKWSVALNAPALLGHTVQRACQLARSAPCGPVFVSVPTEYLLDKADASLPAQAAIPSPVAPDAHALAELAQALSSAQRPLIITEEAGRDPRNVARLVALAEAINASVLEAWQPYYFNFPREHPLYGGVVAEDMVARAQAADVVLLAEAVVPWHPASAATTPRIFALGEDPLRSHLPHWSVPAARIIPGDLGVALDTLLRAVQRRTQVATPQRDQSLVAASTASPASGRSGATPASDGAPSNTLDTRAIALALNELLPAEAVLVNETISHRLDLLRHLTRLGPGGFYESSFGGLGVGLATALGVKNADPRRTVVLAIGDGAFHYNPVVGSLGAAQEHGINLLVILFDNAGYRSQRGDVVTYYPGGEAIRSGRFVGTGIDPRPDYVKLAEAYGGYGETVRTLAELRPALVRGFEHARQRLALLHMRLPAVNPVSGPARTDIP